MQSSSTPAPVNLLWTGGGDSTFRLLQLLGEQEVTVQPWYLMDVERASSVRELEAMEAIRCALAADRPSWAGRLLPIRKVEVASLAHAPDITDMASRLSMASQYEWLARFAREYRLDGLEICVESRPGRLQGMLAPWLYEVRGGGRRINIERLVTGGGDSDLLLFSVFSFPVIHLTKRDMRQLARERGWERWLDLTWFCHNPRGGKACGSCAPCMVAVEEGFANRIPISRRLRPRIRLIKRRLEALVRRV